MSTTNSNSTSNKKRLIKEDPFRRLVARTEEITQTTLKDAYLVNIDLIEPNPNQPRRYIDDARLEELSADIKARGILQPPIVRPLEDGKYQLVVGERRYRAAKMAGLKEIPVLVNDLNDEDARIVSLVENIQREDLDFADEARYFGMLHDEYKYSIRDIAALVNKSKSYVDSRLTLLKNPALLDEVKSDKLGLHEASILARLEKKGINTDGSVREKDTFENDNKSVREKDSSKKNVREKDIMLELSPVSRRFVSLCQSLGDVAHNVGPKIAHTGDEEREFVLETIDALAEELGRLRQRLDSAGF